MAADARVHLRVRGRVQGVFYRVTAQRVAQRLGLHGWVRNCSDGSVELVAEGPRPDCVALVERCREGPPGATVETVDEEWGEPSGVLTAFEVRYDGP